MPRAGAQGSPGRSHAAEGNEAQVMTAPNAAGRAVISRGRGGIKVVEATCGMNPTRNIGRKLSGNEEAGSEGNLRAFNTDRAGPESVSDGAADAGRSPVSSCGESAGDGDTKGWEILAETQTRLQRDERAGREDVPGRLGSGGDAFNARRNSESFVEPGKLSRTEQVVPGYP